MLIDDGTKLAKDTRIIECLISIHYGFPVLNLCGSLQAELMSRTVEVSLSVSQII